MSRPSHCEWCPFPDCDSCAYKGGDALREESKGHLIRTWKRTRKAIPAHVCEVSAA